MELLIILITLGLAIYYMSARVLFVFGIIFSVFVALATIPATEQSNYRIVAFIIAGLYVALMAMWFENTKKDFSIFNSLVAFLFCGSFAVVLSISFLYPLWGDVAYREVETGWWVFSSIENQPKNKLVLFFENSGMIAGPVEELAKLIALVGVMKRKIVSRKTGIYYAVLCAIGFAMIENISYFLRYGEVLPIRANPAHAVFSSIWGAALGSYLAKEKGVDELLRGLVLGMGLHSIWNLFASMRSPIFIYLFILVTLSGLAFIRRELKKKDEEQITTVVN